jgi:hypothetical protein
MLVAYAKYNHLSHERGSRVVILFCSFYFQFCIAKRLAIYKFGGVISAKCYTF